MRGAPSSHDQKLMAGWLWAGPETAVSHRSAAGLWKLDGIDAGGAVELTTTGRRSDVPDGITLHRTKILGPSDAGWLGALKVTGLVRTLIDLGAVVPDAAVVEAAMESALRRDEQLFDRMKERLETLMERTLRKAGIEMPVRQYEVRINGRIIRLDFVWVKRRVALEPRGFWCHSGRRKFQSDIDRANDLALTRWLIIYATWEDLVRRPGKILSQLEDALA